MISICFLCHKEHPGECIECGKPYAPDDDTSVINCYGRCRICQKLWSAPMIWRRMLEGRLTQYGCYFPSTDLNVTEMGQKGTGKPEGVEWL